MRTFYEEWQISDNNLAVTTAELQVQSDTNENISEVRQLQMPNFNDFPVEEFFTHHTAILSQVKSAEELYFLIKKVLTL